VDPGTQKQLDLWETLVGTERIIAANNGAPRLWSHGLRQITAQKAAQLVHAWHKTHDIQDRAEHAITQRNIARDAIESLRLVSKTFMVDAYRQVFLSFPFFSHFPFTRSDLSVAVTLCGIL
jgi:hypothetical protein